MFGLILAATMSSMPSPAPTLPPEIGNVITRANCNKAQRTLVHVLPTLIRNDNSISAAQKAMGDLDATNDPQTRLSLLRVRNLSNLVFKAIDGAKKDVMTLHVLAAASTDSAEAQHFSAMADALDSVIAKQSDISDQLNGYADTADLGLMEQGTDSERQMAAANAPDTSRQKFLDNYRRQHPAISTVNVTQLTHNVYLDLQDMRRDLAKTEGTASQEAHAIAATCTPAHHKP